jgi:hypothetical protein
MMKVSQICSSLFAAGKNHVELPVRNDGNRLGNDKDFHHASAAIRHPEAPVHQLLFMN